MKSTSYKEYQKKRPEMWPMPAQARQINLKLKRMTSDCEIYVYVYIRELLFYEAKINYFIICEYINP